jgi:hypothetical protein
LFLVGRRGRKTGKSFSITFQTGMWRATYVGVDEVGHKGIFGSVILLDGRSNSTLKRLGGRVVGMVLSAGTGADGSGSGSSSSFNDVAAGIVGAGGLVVDVLAPRDVGEVVLIHGYHRKGRSL